MQLHTAHSNRNPQGRIGRGHHRQRQRHRRDFRQARGNLCRVPPPIDKDTDALLRQVRVPAGVLVEAEVQEPKEGLGMPGRSTTL